MADIPTLQGLTRIAGASVPASSGGPLMNAGQFSSPQGTLWGFRAQQAPQVVGQDNEGQDVFGAPDYGWTLGDNGQLTGMSNQNDTFTVQNPVIGQWMSPEQQLYYFTQPGGVSTRAPLHDSGGFNSVLTGEVLPFALKAAGMYSGINNLGNFFGGGAGPASGDVFGEEATNMPPVDAEGNPVTLEPPPMPPAELPEGTMPMAIPPSPQPSMLQDTLPSGSLPGAFSSPGAPVADRSQDFTGFTTGNVGSDVMSILRTVLGGSTGAGALRGGWSPLATAVSLGTGAYGLYQAEQMKKLAKLAAQRSDPFAQYRSGYAAQLSDLMANPSRVTSLPGYQAGLDAVTRKMASQGYLGSGNMMAALQKYGGDFYNNAVNQLSGLAGANQNPAVSSQIEMAGNQNATSIAMQALNRLGYGLLRGAL